MSPSDCLCCVLPLNRQRNIHVFQFLIRADDSIYVGEEQQQQHRENSTGEAKNSLEILCTKSQKGKTDLTIVRQAARSHLIINTVGTTNRKSEYNSIFFTKAVPLLI